MATVTLYALTSDGQVQCSDASYAAARAGTGSLGANNSGTDFRIGQWNVGSFFVFEGFLNFDLAAAGLTSADTINTATLSLFMETLPSNDFTVEAREHNWGSTLETTDFVAGADLGSKTLLASVSTAGLSDEAYFAFAEDGSAMADACQTALAGDGILRLILCSADTRNNVSPTATDAIRVYSADASGTSTDPKLVIDYSVPANISIAESLGLSDSFSRQSTANRAYSDSAATTNAIARLANAVRAYSESAGLANAYQRLSSAARAYVDTLAVANVLTRVLNVSMPVLSDSLGTTNAYARAASAARAYLDSAGLSDVFSVLAMQIGQYGFRFRNDDGDEAAATWLAGQNADVDWPKNSNLRLRIGVDTDGGTYAGVGAKLQYRKVGAADWIDVPVSP